MRTEKSILNVESNFFIYTFRSIMLFIVRTIFIKVLGKEYLGLDGLFTNILFVLSITELGISNAINYSLYKPLANKDYKKISSLMSFYKRLYIVIGTIIAVLGLIIMVFLNRIVKTAPSDINIYIIYAIYLFDTVNLYFISYKETLIIADQKNYKLTGYNFIFFLILYLLQIFVLVKYHSFLLYLLVKITVLLVQRVLINRYITKEYKEVNFNCDDKVDSKDMKVIKTNIKGMFFHKLGFYAVNSTDNIIISAFLNLSLVGIYSNYLSLLSMLNTLLSSSYKAITSSFGNLIVMENKEMQESIFEKINYAGHLLYSFVSIGLVLLINQFITLWIGQSYRLSFIVVIFICMNFYIEGMRQSIDSIKDASGTYDQDKYIPIIQAVLNIIISVALVKPLGILGVVLGTFISNILLPCWNRPYVIYKYVFKSSPRNYYINYIKNLIVVFIISFISYYAITYLNLKVSLINFIINILVYCVIYFILIFIIYFKNDNFKFYIDLFKTKIIKTKKNNE